VKPFGLPKRLEWRGTSKSDFQEFPREAQREMGFALYLAQMGERHPVMTRTLKGFGGAGVVEIRESFGGNAYRAIYTVRFADAVHVLHAFQKKSKRGDETPKPDLDLIVRRLRELTAERGGMR
jgi:phage-related protein